MQQACFDILGLRVWIRANFYEFDVVMRMLRSFAPCRSEVESADLVLSILDDTPNYVVFAGDAAITAVIHRWELLRLIESEIERLLLKRAEGYFLLHAAAIVRQGGTVLLPGVSGSGKSTLALGMIAHNCTYLSDEIAALDLDGALVHPFAKPVTLKAKHLFPEYRDRKFGAADNERFAQCAPVWYVHPDDIHVDAVATSSPLRAIVLPTYAPDYPSRIEPISPAAVVNALVRCAINWDSVRFRLVLKLVRELPCYTLRIHDLDSALARLELALDRTALG